MEPAKSKWHTIFIYAALTVATAVAYEPIRHNDFVNFDDNVNITHSLVVKTGLTNKSVVWAFTTGYGANWHPLTWLSHMLDVELFGMAPLGHHLVSVFFHLINVLLVFWVFKRMTGAVWRSAFIAAVFALHPLRVESVAWAAERKDVLSGMFWLLTMAAYIRYTERPRLGRYLLVLLSLALGLMAKPMLVTLPFVLLLMDYWPLRRFQWRRKDQLELQDSEQTESAENDRQGISIWRLLSEKIPMLALVAASSIVTYIVQQSGGSMGQVGILPLHLRIANAFMSYAGYIGKMVCPIGLAPLYPHSSYQSMQVWRLIISILIMLVILSGAIYFARRKRYLAVGWLWYVGTLVPVIGLVQVGTQAMADRYTYLPAIGISVIVAWGAAELLTNWRSRRIWLAIAAAGALLLLGGAGVVIMAAWVVAEIIAERRYQRRGLKITALVTLAILLICTRIQVGHWKNSVTLCEHSIAVTEDNFVMHNNYGQALLSNDQIDEAITHYQESLRINPEFMIARRNLGTMFLRQEKLDDALACFDEVLNVHPDWPDALSYRGLTYAWQGRYDLAMRDYHKALELEPNFPMALNHMQLTLQHRGKLLAEAVSEYENQLQIDPNQFSLHNRLADAFREQNKIDQAINHLNESLRLNPNQPLALVNLAKAYSHQDNTEKALACWNRVLQLEPDWPLALNNIAWIKATHQEARFRNPAEAIQLATRACELTDYQDPGMLDTLAYAYAADERFPQAVETAQKALNLARSANREQIADKIQKHLELFKQGKLQ